MIQQHEALLTSGFRGILFTRFGNSISSSIFSLFLISFSALKSVLN